jgi:septum formation protein
MQRPFILASASDTRRDLLTGAGLSPIQIPARVDENTILAALQDEGAHPRDIADTLAEMKAQKIAARHATALVLGCDQVLALGKALLMKPRSGDHAKAQLSQMQGRTHHLYAAIVLYDQGQPIWRHVGVARMTMHPLSDAAIAAYVDENWHIIQHAVGCYRIEDSRDALFSAIEGDTTTIQGLPMPPLMDYLHQRGFIT